MWSLHGMGNKSLFKWMDGWVRVLHPFNSISVILRRWKGEHERLCAMKLCSNGPGHMTNMAAMSIHGKNLKQSSSLESNGWWPWKLHWALKYYQVCSNDDPGLTLTYFTARSNLVTYAFVREKSKTMDFLETYCRLWFETSNRWPKWQEVSVDIKTLSPRGCMPPAPGIYTCIKSWKKL